MNNINRTYASYSMIKVCQTKLCRLGQNNEIVDKIGQNAFFRLYGPNP